MSKSFKIFAFYALLLTLAQSLKSLENEKIPFNPSEIQSKSNNLKNGLEILPIKVIFNSSEYVIVGRNGTFIFSSGYRDETNIFDPETIEKESSFSTFMIEENQLTLNTNCRLWKPEKTIKMICDANFFEEGSHSVEINGQSFEYRNKYLIKVTFYGNLKFKQEDIYYPFLYSYEQNINIIGSLPSYELKFKFNSYYDEILYIYRTEYSYTALNNCEKKDQELTCRLSKEKIEEILVSKNEHFKLGLKDDTHGTIFFNYVYPININYENVQKEDIYIKLEKLIEGVTEIETSFAFETNVTKIPNLISDSINFIPECSSYFKKIVGKPLILFTKCFLDQTITIPSIQKEKIFGDKHYKYNFRIQPSQIDETIIIKNIGTNYTHLSYSEDKPNIFYEKCLLKDILSENGIYMSIKAKDNEKEIKIDSKGVFTMVTNYNDKEKKIFNSSDTINFVGTLINKEDDKVKFIINCRFLSQKDDNLRIICKFTDYTNNLPSYMLLEKTVVIYNDKRITICDNEPIAFKEYNDYIQFLYDERKVNISFLDGEKSGVFNAHHLNHEENYSMCYNSPPIKMNLSYETIEININQKDNDHKIVIGEKGMLYLKSEYNDKAKNFFNDSTIEENTKFSTSIIYENRFNYKVFCRLWKNEKGLIYIFCEINEFFSKGTHEVKINEAEFFYNKYKIKIVPKLDYILMEQYEEPLPFLYSKNQTIRHYPNSDPYYLKFNIGYYNNEKLIAISGKMGYLILDKCLIVKKELICKIENSELEEIFSTNNLILKAYLPRSGSLYWEFPMIDKISLNYELQKKKSDNYVYKIEKDDHYFDVNNYFMYRAFFLESSEYILTENFQIDFKDKNRNIIKGDCFLKKIKEQDHFLYVLCKAGNQDANLSFSMHEKYTLGNINPKYTFILETNKEITKYIKTNGSAGIFISEKVLNFYLADKFTIDFILDYPNNTKSIKLDNGTEDLNCQDLYEFVKRCEIPRSYFKENISNKYYVYHLNHMNKYIKFFEFSPLRVIFPGNNEIPIRILKKDHNNGIKIGKELIFSFLTEFNDTERKIFNVTDIDNIIFNTNITDENNNKYKANCRLWKANDEIIRIICKLNNILKYSKQYIIFDQVKVEYGTYKIVIQQVDYIEATQYNYSVPFLYSNKSKISVSSSESNYYLSFNVESYNNELLYIYGDLLNYEILDNCKLNDKKLICEISKEKIEGLLTIDNSTYKIGAIHDNIGIIQLNNILDISITYPQIEKKDIYLQYTKVINPNPEARTFFGFETNVTEISSNINSIPINDYCHFRKTDGNPLMLLCMINKIDNIAFPVKSEKVTYDKIHYKYNFRVQPYQKETLFSINNFGTNVKLIYPAILDFTNKDSLTIRYIMTNPSLAKNIKLNLDSADLICENLEGMKKCTAHKDHFIKKQSGSYRTLYSNHENNFIEYYESSSIKVTLPQEKIIQIIVSDEENNQEIDIGDSGVVYFISKYKDEKNIFNSNDIDEKTEFNTTITDKNLNNYESTCRLWKIENEAIRIFCDLNKKIIYQNIKLNSASLTYNGHKIAIISQMNFAMKINQLSSKTPFIYSDKQIIEVEKEKDLYEIKFKVLEYHNEQLILLNIEKDGEEELNNILLDDCDLNGKDLKCYLARVKIEEILGYSGQEFKLNYLDDDRGQLGALNNTLNIKINYNSIQKKDVIIKLTKLMDDQIGANNYIAYETDVTSIDNIITNKFKLNDIACLLKKDKEKPLLMLCKISSQGEINIGEIKEEIKLNNVNIKYNLLIQARDKTDKITIKYDGGNILFATPMKLDFFNYDEINITFYLKDYFDYNDIRLNKDSDKGILCNHYGNIVKCLVNKNHFNYKMTGNYYTYIKNKLEEYKISYELSPISVELPDSEETIIRIKNININDSIKIGQNGVISFITDFRDSGNIFDKSYFENKVTIKMTFSAIVYLYNADCYLWKPAGENLRLICKFVENIKFQKLELNRCTFDYNNKKISIISKKDLKIKQLGSTISFLYSDRQIININDTATEYNLVFKEEIYNKEPLILYNDDNNRKNLYLSCEQENKELKCTISKDKLIGLLSKSGEKFCLSQLTQEEGLLKFENVLDITINYDKVVKKEINLNITKLLTQSVEKNNYIVFETNITEDIPIITTNYFNLNPNKNDAMKCLFKKSSNQKDDKLLILCNADTPGVYKFDISKTELNDLNILYSFKIPKTSINENVTVSEKEGTKILSVYPDSLDFTSQDTLTIKYQTENPERLKDIKLNTSTSSLECKDKNGIKECTVPQNHFNISGSYYTYYTNSLGAQVISYEIPKIQVTVKQVEAKKKVNVGLIVGCVVGGVVLIAVIVIIIVVVKKKRANLNEINEGKIGKILPKSEQVELIEGDKFGN